MLINYKPRLDVTFIPPADKSRQIHLSELPHHTYSHNILHSPEIRFVDSLIVIKDLQRIL